MKFNPYMSQPFVLVLGCILAVTLVSLQAWAGDASAPTTRTISDVCFSNIGQDVVIVTYDLQSSIRRPYRVTMHLSSDGGRTFDYRPRTVSGDVNRLVYPGPHRIVWNMRQDLPEGPPSGECVFRVTAEPPLSKWWLVGGGVLVAAGTTALILALLPANEENGRVRITVPAAQ